MKVLELNNIHKSYGATKALNGVSFSVPKGSIFGILGPNGSGKTTLLSIILDVLKANDGSYTWLSETPSAMQRQSIGTLLETPNFYHYLSASRNLEITRQISGRGSAGDIDIALKKVKLYDRRGSKFSTYSLGMKQRLAIGAALLGLPSILVLDEPTNGLDPVGIVEIRELILELNANGHTIIIASHLLDEVEKICTHVAIMKFGNLLTCGPVDEVMANDDCVEVGADNSEALLIVMGKYPGVLNISTEKDLVVVGLQKGTADLEEINRFCFNSGIVLNHLYMRKQKLETRFFELTQN
ncbi:ABC transporter ATP-binding protein [Pinibacter aurantiacus]|uniref:ABC transporter ATP-binding protein n=1 Tax=Pinibacter aurantiacus TaxID=2851599 RepID=A0A9E2SCT1_9BACT|nr:ABC transporter ATP-binding protein [Pinibacter aurantiacus]MBV4358724.1 ABC transporter ATP-binding protein [Pinibacter aurantiacus]